MGVLRSVNVVHEIHDDPGQTPGRTAIDKRPHAGPVTVAVRGLSGDAQLDTLHHGGPEQAVYAYAEEDLDWWVGELGRVIAPGTFGENFTTSGIDVTNAVIGEQWAIGTADGVVVEVTAPRIPCQTFSHWIDEPRWVKRFTAHGAPGAYLRVLQEGRVEAGDPISLRHKPAHGIRIADVFPTPEPEQAQALLEAARAGQVRLAGTIAAVAQRAAARLQPQ